MPDEHEDQQIQPDARLYISQPAIWEATVKQEWEKEYCYQQNPGEDFFHLLIKGEIHLQHDKEKLCLNCAMKRGLLSKNRLSWQGREE